MTKILIVDDSKFSCKRESEIIRSHYSGSEVDVAFLPSEAIELVLNQNREYDLIFLDYNMPEMTGLELIDRLKEKVSLNRMVILTASSAFATKAHDVPEGVRFIQKPLASDKLSDISIPTRESA